MKMTIAQALEMIDKGETVEQYEKRIRRIRRLANERDALTDGIEILEQYGDSAEDKKRAEKKRTRLAKVLAEIDALK